MNPDTVLLAAWFELLYDAQFMATFYAFNVAATSRETGAVVTVRFEDEDEPKQFPKWWTENVNTESTRLQAWQLGWLKPGQTFNLRGFRDFTQDEDDQ